MLKVTDIKLELMTDIDMFQFIEKGTRGGISYIANRYGKANNKYMKDNDKNELSKYIMYFDANNLYGWAMCQHLPTGGFKWLNEKEFYKIDLQKHEGNKGFIAEVDIEYPDKLYDLYNDYPLAPEKNKVARSMLAPYCEKIREKFNITVGQVNKLIPTLKNKKKNMYSIIKILNYTKILFEIYKVS